MTQPLALIFYERLMPGSQLANRLQDLNYRVLAVNDLAVLPARVRAETPLLVLADLGSGGHTVCQAIAALKADAATQHIPVLAFAAENAAPLMEAAQKAGATLVAGETAMVNHLPQLLNQVLQVD